MSVTTLLEPEIDSPSTEAAPRSEDNSEFYEVVRGVKVEHAPMGAREGILANRLNRFCLRSGLVDVRGQTVIEVTVVLRRNPTTKRRPDFAFVSFERWPEDREAPPGDAWDVVPELAAEIISPSNQAEDVLEKIQEYFAAGVRLVWVIYPNVAQVYVYHSATDVRIVDRGGELDGEEILPGLRIPMTALFPHEPVRTIAQSDEPI